MWSSRGPSARHTHHHRRLLGPGTLHWLVVLYICMVMSCVPRDSAAVRRNPHIAAAVTQTLHLGTVPPCVLGELMREPEAHCTSSAEATGLWLRGRC